MIKAMELLEREIKRIRAIAVKLNHQSLYMRAKYRHKEANRFQAVLDLLEAEYYSWK